MRAEWCCDHGGQREGRHRGLAPTLGACFLRQPPVPGMEESMSYQAPPQQLPAAQPPQPANPPHGAHTLNSGPQPGTAPATQHSQAGPASGQAYGPHTYSEPAKPKKGQQLWNRMKRKLAVYFGEERTWRLDRGVGMGCMACWSILLILLGCWAPQALGAGAPEQGVSSSWGWDSLRGEA